MSGAVAASVVGGSIISGVIGARGAKSAARTSAASADRAAELSDRQFQQTRQDLEPFQRVARGDPIFETDDQGNQVIDPATGQPKITGFTGGALQQLAEFGRSQVSPGDFIPGSNIPRFEGGQEIPRFQGGPDDISLGDIPELTRLDLESDPGVKFRRQEQERGINRAAAGTGKVLSGNRLEEILQRSGDLASQEFGAAFNRNLTEFDIRRQREQEQFGRERGRESEIFGRDLTRFGIEREREQEGFGRDLTRFGLDAAREADLRQRGIGDFDRARAEETDFLNRLAALSQTGQTAATNVASLGARSASETGANIRAAGQATAAGQIGRASAIQQGIGDITSLAARFRPGGVTTTSTPVRGFDL